MARASIPVLNSSHDSYSGLLIALLGGGQGTTTAEDSTSGNNDGTLTNMTAGAWSLDGTLDRYVLSFDGAEDYVQIPSITGLNGQTFSMAAWVWWKDAGTSFARILDRVYDGQFSVYVTEATRQIGVALVTSGGSLDYSNVSNVNSVPASDTAWVHVGVTYDGADVRVYINGVVDGTVDFPNGTLATSTAAIRLGQRVDDGGTARYFEGKLSDLLVWNRAITGDEMAGVSDPDDPTLGGLVLDETTGSPGYAYAQQ